MTGVQTCALPILLERVGLLHTPGEATEDRLLALEVAGEGSRARSMPLGIVGHELVHRGRVAGRERLEAHRAQLSVDPRVKDLDKRFRWDLCYAAGLSGWLCDEVYKYANDTHVDTALRHAIKTIGF